MSEEKTLCKNCAEPLHGAYCSNCGQKLISKRYTVFDSIQMVFNQVFNLERGILFTLKELLVSPQKVTLDYINGVTIKYFHPFRFLLVFASISAVLNYYFQSIDMVKEYFGMVKEDAEDTKKVGDIVNQNLTLIILAAIPIFSFFTKLFYRKRDFNYTEHLIINAYANGLASALGLITYIFYAIPPLVSIGILISSFLTFFVAGYVFSKTMNENYFLSLFKYLFAFSLSLISLMFVGIIIGIAYKMITTI
jgi:hypothetical protein